MADLTIQNVVEAGLNPTYVAAAAGGDAALNLQGDVFLHVKNGHTASQTVTVVAQDTSESVPGFGGMTKASPAVAIAASGAQFIGPFPRQAFNDSAEKVQLTYSGVTLLTIAAVKLPKAS